MRESTIQKIEIGKWLYSTDSSKKYRYVLGRKGKSNLVCIGVNPSIGIPNNPEQTVQRVELIAKNNDFDGWLMLNLYPQVTKNPNTLDEKMNVMEWKNCLCSVKTALLQFDAPKVVWAAWGNLITKRKYLQECLFEMLKIFPQNSVVWKAVGMTVRGNPFHPLYCRTNSSLVCFDVDQYVKKFNAK